MRILIWHGYLLGGRARMSTRARSRANGATRATTSSSSRRSRTRSSTTSAERDRAARARRPAAGLRARPLRGPRAAPAPGAHDGGAEALRRAQRGRRARSCCLPISSSPTMFSRAQRSERRAARRSPSRRTAPSSSTRCAGTRSCRRGGGRRSPEPRRSSSARSTSARCSRTWSATSIASTRCRPEWTSTSFDRGRDGEALAALLEEARQDPPNPGNANERVPDEGNAERLAAFFAGDQPTVLYFGKLLYNKGVHLLLEALRELDARAVIVGFGDYRTELEAPRRPARSSPGPSSTATSSTCSRSPT